MLVLTRKQNEKIRIGENITITVLRMKGKGVRLGIQAPEEMNVLRGELVFDLEQEEQPCDRCPDQATSAPEFSPSSPFAGHAKQTVDDWSNEFRPSPQKSPATSSADAYSLGWCI